MFYLELLENQMLKDQLKNRFKANFRNSEKMNETLSGFEREYLRPLEKRIEDLIQCPEEQLPVDYIQIKRDMFEMYLWFEIFKEALNETASSVTLNAMNMRLQTDEAMLERLFNVLTLLEEKVLTLRAEKNLVKQGAKVHQSLETIKALLKHASVKENADPDQISLILKDQEAFFRYIAQFFQDKVPEWEKTVVSNARGILFSDPKRFPFSAVYTLQGNLYIFLEIVGHFIGIGGTKIGCRAVKLQTAELFALIKSRTAFPNIADPKEIAYKLDYSFNETLHEAKILERFIHRQGIVQLRDRFAFSIDGVKQICLIEDYFKDGSLEKHLADPQNCKLDLKQKISIAVQLLTGARNIFEAGYVHSDIKPGNILIDLKTFPIPIAAITDFNTAFPINEPSPAGLLSHTPAWCTPEVASVLGAEDQSLEAKERLIAFLPYRDIWSLGLIFYEFFFEEPLSWINEPEDKVFKTIAHLKGNWIPARFSKRPFYSLIQQMTSIDPKKRPTATQAFDRFLQECKKLAISP
ncbi:MAG: protein kinase [Verrucomicrobia bacterium]|nr:protein kinase [Verrucomicrobiota bacterium]